MFATDTVAVPTAILAAGFIIVLGGVISFVAWQTKQIIEHGRIMTTLKNTVSGDGGHGERLHSLEAWRDGVNVGRAVEKGSHRTEEHNP